MANAATVQGTVPIGYASSGVGLKTSVVNVLIDTTGADLTVLTVDSDKYWAILGISYVETDAHNLTIKSGSTTLVTYEFTTNSGLVHPMGNGILLTGIARGSNLVIQSSVAISSMVFYVQQFKELPLFGK